MTGDLVADLRAGVDGLELAAADEIENLTKEIDNASRMNGWRLISTAPMDGSEILLWAPNTGARVGYYSQEFNDAPEADRPHHGWWSLTGEISPRFPAWRDLEESPAIYPPSHWMPQPAPPVEASSP